MSAQTRGCGVLKVTTSEVCAQVQKDGLARSRVPQLLEDGASVDRSDSGPLGLLGGVWSLQEVLRQATGSDDDNDIRIMRDVGQARCRGERS